MNRDMGVMQEASRNSKAATSVDDTQRDRVILSFTLLLVGLLAVFASALTLAEPSPLFNGLTTVQP